jgi:hypothetical protein
VSSLRVVEVLDVVGNGDREFDVGPGSLAVDQLSLVETVEALGEGIVIVLTG